MGAITNIVKQYVPASYAALVGATNTYYSLEELQGLADFVKFRLYNTVVATLSEAAVYNPKELRLLGILTTLQFIPAAVDFWGDSLSSTTTTGTSESNAYFDHRTDLWKIFDRLTTEAQALSEDIGVNIYAARGVVPKVSYGDNGREILITGDPQEFPPAWDNSLNTDRDFIIWDVVNYWRSQPD